MSVSVTRDLIIAIIGGLIVIFLQWLVKSGRLWLRQRDATSIHNELEDMERTGFSEDALRKTSVQISLALYLGGVYLTVLAIPEPAQHNAWFAKLLLGIGIAALGLRAAKTADVTSAKGVAERQRLYREALKKYEQPNPPNPA